MKRLIIATGNMGKLNEIKEIMNSGEIEIVSMKEAGVDVDIVEDGKTFEENALIKARAVSEACGGIVLSDDSGLEVDYLNKEPGIYSARYLGEDTPYSIKNAKILERLDGVPDEKRTGRFVCAVAAVFPDGKEIVVRETMEGRIGYEERGTNGFGYDPIFRPDGYDVSSGELPMEEKNLISHRGKAFRKMWEILSKTEEFR
ncbi:MAG: RdgB/HAM1 family non-canonical purine NTP pyrophosphatase [Lachnospiraceae bacterium]|nr:RdgB/HAM1 family non-canonical purine NTP pyrophosphatase [Lachnospiraceae bacterium]